MCVDIHDPKLYRATKDMTAYKVVIAPSAGNFVSQFPPAARGPQWEGGRFYWPFHRNATGSRMTYEFGKRARSSLYTTPGLYCWAAYSRQVLPHYLTLLKVRIPAGTYYRKARSNGRSVLLVEELVPICVANEG